MTIYADILVLVNLYVDYFLLRAVKKFLGLRARPRRLVLGALTGGLLSLAALLPVEGPACLALEIAAALAVTAAAFAPLPLRTLGKAAGCFWLCTLGLAGCVLFLLRFFTPRRLAVLGNVVYLDLSLPLLFLCTCGAYAVFELARRLLPEGRSALRCRWLIVEHGGKSVRVFAKADTGNQLREPFSGLPVIVCQADCLREIAPPEVLAYLDSGGAETAGPALRLVPFDSLGGAGVLPAFRPDSVRLADAGAPLACYTALCPRPLSAGQFQALADPALFPDPQPTHGGT